MAPIGLKLGQNAFQVIPDISFVDIENQKFFGFFGLDCFCPGQNACVLARTHVSWPGHMCPGQDKCVLGQENPLHKNKHFLKIPQRESPTYVGDSPQNPLHGQGPRTYPLHVRTGLSSVSNTRRPCRIAMKKAWTGLIGELRTVVKDASITAWVYTKMLLSGNQDYMRTLEAAASCGPPLYYIHLQN